MRKTILALLSMTILLTVAGKSDRFAAPEPELWSRWQVHDPAGAERIDHSPWGRG